MYKVPNANSTNDIRKLYAHHYTHSGMRDLLILGSLTYVALALVYNAIHHMFLANMVLMSIIGGVFGIGIGYILGLVAIVLCRLLPLNLLQSRWFSFIISLTLGAVETIITLLMIDFITWIAIISGIVVAGWTWWRSQTLPVAATDHAAVVEPLQQ